MPCSDNFNSCAMLNYLKILSFLLACIQVIAGYSCSRQPENYNWEEINSVLDLETRLEDSSLEITEADPDAILMSRELISGMDLPSEWPIQFASREVQVPDIDFESGLGIVHTDSHITVVYPFEDFIMPGYSQFRPLGIAHYIIPSNDLDILVLLVCFQTDPDGSPEGLMLRSLDIEGRETSAPFAVTLPSGELAGRFFYDEFIESGRKFSLAANSGWSRGFLLLTRLDGDFILSTYLPWY